MLTGIMWNIGSSVEKPVEGGRMKGLLYRIWTETPVYPMAAVCTHHTTAIALSMLLDHCTNVSVADTRTH